MDTGTVCCLTHLEIVSTEKRTRVLCVHLCECVQVYARASVCVCGGGGGGGVWLHVICSLLSVALQYKKKADRHKSTKTNNRQK